jgi:DNA-binding PadR family transcriptional regulator
VSTTHPAKNRLSPEFALLGFLYRSPDHGYNLHKQLSSELGNIWHASQSQTYNILKRLEENRYITSTAINQPKLPARQLLHITETGRARFEEWLESPTNCSVHAIRVEFITRLYFLELLQPQRMKQAIEDQRQVVLAGLAQLQTQRKNHNSEQNIEGLAIDLRVKLLVSLLDWLDECEQFSETGEMIRGKDV